MSEEQAPEEVIMIPISIMFPPNAGQTMKLLGLSYDMVVSNLKVVANGVTIPPTARLQLYVGGVLCADLNAYAASLDSGAPLRDVPPQITRTDLIRVRGDLPEGVQIILSGVGTDDFGPQHEDWTGSSPVRPAQP